MGIYLRALGVLLIALGVAGSAFCWNAAKNDEAYFKAVRGLEKYPGNVLYQTEFKMAEPRHMLLVSGAVGTAPVALVWGSLCLGLGQVLRRTSRNP
jgi:hypothetical protein